MSEETNIHVVRLSTVAWSNGRGVHLRKSLITLRRKSSGFQILEEECNMIGCDEAIRMITNLNSCEDGIYSVETCDEQRDWETGQIDSYNFKLVPFKS